MGLVAFRTAGQWISLSEPERGVQQGNPTPTQHVYFPAVLIFRTLTVINNRYGLLMSLLGANSYGAIARASAYSARRSRSQLPRMFIEALFFSILLYFLTHAIGLTDLWVRNRLNDYGFY